MGGLLLAIGLEAGSASDDSADDPVLDFYCRRAAEITAANDSALRRQSYSFVATSRYSHLGSGGKVKRTDSAVVRYLVSDGAIDSRVPEIETASRFHDLDFTVPNVFSGEYHFGFFPNDTGGQYLAIGFDTDSLADPHPVGFAIIDRHHYYSHWLYLSYANLPGYKRLSRWIHFARHDEFSFPDTVVELGAKSGILSPQFYRIETVISDFELQR